MLSLSLSSSSSFGGPRHNESKSTLTESQSCGFSSSPSSLFLLCVLFWWIIYYLAKRPKWEEERRREKEDPPIHSFSQPSPSPWTRIRQSDHLAIEPRMRSNFLIVGSLSPAYYAIFFSLLAEGHLFIPRGGGYSPPSSSSSFSSFSSSSVGPFSPLSLPLGPSQSSR